MVSCSSSRRRRRPVLFLAVRRCVDGRVQQQATGVRGGLRRLVVAAEGVAGLRHGDVAAGGLRGLRPARRGGALSVRAGARRGVLRGRGGALRRGGGLRGQLAVGVWLHGGARPAVHSSNASAIALLPVLCGVLPPAGRAVGDTLHVLHKVWAHGKSKTGDSGAR